MAMRQASKVLDERVRALAEDYETQVGEAIAQITERFEGKIESLVQEFGEPLVEIMLKHYPINMPRGGTLYSVFKAMVSGNEQSTRGDVDEEL
jgi:hypothetical protein